MRILVLICRWLVGLLFIFSGLIKANDPLGFSYKLEEYFTVFGTDWLAPAALGISIFICIIEVVLGVLVIAGIWMRLTSWLLLLMIIFFTFLTFYSAYFNKVTDCGCFGDAIKLTPWESFTKDVILLVLILIIFFWKDKVRSPFNEKWNMLLAGITTLLVTFFTFYCYWHLPVIDFRPYKIGNNITEKMTRKETDLQDIYEITFLYKNQATGEEKEFSQENYPWQDTTWVYVDRYDKLIQEGTPLAIKDFQISDADGLDQTEAILMDPVPIFIVVSYDLNKADKSAFDKLNQFAQEATQAGMQVIGFTASTYDITETFRHEVQTPIPFYFADATMLKTIIRSNPGLVLLEQGTIKGKWHYNDIPPFSELTINSLDTGSE